MFCFLYKWMISRALDMGRVLPTPVNRHIRRCRVCREFARFSQSLAARLVRDAPGFLRENSDTLAERMVAGLAAKPGTEVTQKPRKPRKLRKMPKPFFIPRPALGFAAAVVILVVSAGIIFKVIPTPTPRTTGIDENIINNIGGPAFTETPLKGITGRLESSIEVELRSLKNSVKSAADHLYSCLDVKIGDKGEGR
jgi:hypothetical protein